MNPQDIVSQPLDQMDIKSLSIDNDRFGPLGFDKSLPILEVLREIFVDFEKFGYRTKLPDNLVEPFRRDQERFVGYLRRLATFDLRSDPNFRSEHDSFENEIQGFYQDFFQRYGAWLTYLRQDTERKSTDKKAIEEERKLLVEARKQSESLLQELQKLKEEKDRLQSKKGEIGATKLALHFGSEVSLYQGSADVWFMSVIVGYASIILSIVGIAIYYTFFGDWTGISWQSGTAKIIFFASLWYGLSFLIRNYNINSHLAAVNRHRTAVALTLEDFLESNSERQSEMLKNATEAMFKHAPIGFVTKAEKDSGNPILEVVNKIIGAKGGE